MEKQASKSKAPSVTWEEDEMELEEVPRCECCGEYIYNWSICPSCGVVSDLA